MKVTFALTLFALLFNIFLALPLKEIEDAKNPEEAGFFEGDMELNEEQMATILYPGKRNIRKKEDYWWPNNIVHYEFSKQFNEEQKEAIENALKEIEQHTCIQFKRRTAITHDYIHITGHNTGCHGAVGRQNGKQTLNLHVNTPGKGCLKHGTIMHEFLHALGFYHQQSASNRDDYVSIIWENIKEKHEKNFDKFPKSLVTDFGIDYDYSSIMHYGAKAFTKNGKPTIVPHDKTAVIGQRDGLSKSDIKKLNIMYKCPGYEVY